MTEVHHRDSMGGAPACASIIGDEGIDGKIETRETINWHNHRPIGLHEGLPTDAKRLVAGHLCRSPVHSAIAGGTHLDPVAQRIVVKLSVTVAKERAGGCIIADRPVLVVKMAIIIHHDWVAPGRAPIGRATDEHINRIGPIRKETQERDQPHRMLGIEGH